MKVGIITFHWATNYGAVLQCYALQKSIIKMGYNVSIINYKPRQYDNTLWAFVRFRKFLHLKSFVKELAKEKLISLFRNKHLNQTNRYYSIEQLKRNCDFDIVISGSDQVLNSSFLLHGEKGGSTAYFIDFGTKNTKKIMYAVSFGTTKYPQNCIEKASHLILDIDSISTRENTGLDIIKQCGREDAIVVPDPTILLKPEDYFQLYTPRDKTTKTSLYMLRGREKYIANLDKFTYVNNNGGSIEDWLATIHSSKNVITNSFHGLVFCILFHIPFLVVLQTKDNIGMNDRFFSLLAQIGLDNRITTESECEFEILDKPIEWQHVDNRLNELRTIGLDFLKGALKNFKKGDE